MSANHREKKTCSKRINDSRTDKLANKMWMRTGRVDSICHFYFAYSISTLAEFFTVNLSSPMNNITLR